ncbi:probable lysophospholipase BODYGUARD 4 isoform X4 [Jatropha curcas]|uniref:probable lysophospholipase BODYGUARD 4 isoform X4 n=1 Tax=Jatropha curcas TaxID=180498 RepID=UPI0009D6C084|nr:probable lysophospholipase BODYGUARD 4 isoform X4 [Jatropha curcas]
MPFLSSSLHIFYYFLSSMFPPFLLRKCARKSAAIILSAVSFIVFLFLDFLEIICCIIYRYLDEFFEGKAYPCYCENRGLKEESELSETLHKRKNVFRQMGFLGFARKWENCKKPTGDGGGLIAANQWSDCGCESCTSWIKDGGGQNLHVVVREPSGDHLEMIEKSVINNPFELKSFHLVAHSMGCIIALALAAKYSNCVKSITLIAPPYFPSSKEGASSAVLNKLAGKRLWPPLLFGSSLMSWYEHLGRCVCFLVCRNHRIWERILKLLTWRRDLHFMIIDLTKHTHHSAWHTMHNVVCGGAKFADDFLETLVKSTVKIFVIHGDRDNVVPLECSKNIKNKVPTAEVSIIPNADHVSVIIGREKEFTLNLERICASVVE